MFSKLYRIPGKTRLNSPSIDSSSLFILKFVNNRLNYSRYRFIVSKAVDKRSAVRNRVKRRIRACIEETHKSIKKGFDILFIIKKEALDKDYKQLVPEVKAILSKNKLY